MRISHTEEKAIKELLIGHRVKVDGDVLILDNGVRLKVEPNEGCSCCESGNYHIDYLNEADNAITNVEMKDTCNGEQHVYEIFVFAEDTKVNLLSVSGDDGNGWYRTGFDLEVCFDDDEDSRKEQE